MSRFILMIALPSLFATYMPSCRTPQLAPMRPAHEVQMEEFWNEPKNVARADLLHGAWGLEYAPDPTATYTFVKAKQNGINPGMTVTDPLGRSWQVKQAPHDNRHSEGPVEVVLSRVLSAVGYHQPPIYFVPSFTLADDFGTRTEPGGRFRLNHKTLKDRGTWSWHENPFVGTKPYQGLLVILMMFNASDLKNSNNTLYDFRRSRRVVERWYVVRDLGTALGSTAKVRPERSNPDMFERLPFITAVEHGFVVFNYRGWHQELVLNRITPDDVRWAADLLARLTEDQWHDAFRAGGYDGATAGRFIGRLRAKIAEGRQLAIAAD